MTSSKLFGGSGIGLLSLAGLLLSSYSHFFLQVFK
jgi:hypothetical protein